MCRLFRDSTSFEAPDVYDDPVIKQSYYTPKKVKKQKIPKTRKN